MLLFLVGYMGCGKSSIGRPLAKRLGMQFVDMDTEIERRCGMSVRDFFAAHGEQEFRRYEHEVLQELSLIHISVSERVLHPLRSILRKLRQWLRCCQR